MPYLGLCTASHLNAVFHSTVSLRSVASSGDLHCTQIPFVILLIPFIFSLVAMSLSMMDWHCSVILRACILIKISLVSEFVVVRVISYGSCTFLCFSCISLCLTRASTIVSVVTLSFETMVSVVEFFAAI